MEAKTYYKIPISMWWFWFWLIITVLFTIISMGILFISLLIPLVIFFQLKNTVYKYNEEEFIIRKGIIFKTRKNISMKKIEEIDTKIGLLTLVVQAKPIALMNIKNPENEMEKLAKAWNNSK